MILKTINLVKENVWFPLLQVEKKHKKKKSKDKDKTDGNEKSERKEKKHKHKKSKSEKRNSNPQQDLLAPTVNADFDYGDYDSI